VKVWDAETMEVKGTLTGHSSSVTSVAFSPDGKTLASGSNDKTLKVWDAETMEVKGTLTGHSMEVTSVAFSPDGKTLASGSYDKTLKVWDAETMEVKGTLTGHSWEVTSVAFSPDGKTLASGSGDETLKVWDAETREVKGTLTGHSGKVESVAFSPDGKTLASGSDDKTVTVWDAETMEVKATLTGLVTSWQQLDAGTKALAAKVKEGRNSRDNRSGQYLVTADGDLVYVYLVTSEGVKQEEPLAVFRSPSSVPVVCCRGAYIVVGCDDGQVRSRTLSSGMRREAQATVRAHLAWVYYTHAA